MVYVCVCSVACRALAGGLQKTADASKAEPAESNTRKGKAAAHTQRMYQLR
jgi:hypothetical protein